MTVPSTGSAAPNEPGAPDPGKPAASSAPTDRIWTIPNALSVLRLLGVPLFLWLILQPVFHGPHYDGWALLILAISGATDYFDGVLARALG